MSESGTAVPIKLPLLAACVFALGCVALVPFLGLVGSGERELLAARLADAKIGKAWKTPLNLEPDAAWTFTGLSGPAMFRVLDRSSKPVAFAVDTDIRFPDTALRFLILLDLKGKPLGIEYVGSGDDPRVALLKDAFRKNSFQAPDGGLAAGIDLAEIRNALTELGSTLEAAQAEISPASGKDK